MTISTKISIITILITFTAAFLPVPVSASDNTFALSESNNTAFENEPNEDGRVGVPRELNLEDLVTLQIIQQPAGNTNFVSSYQNYVTEFQAAAYFGTIGLLAHNYLAGQYFLRLSPGQVIELVYDNGEIESFIVTQIQQYQAISPNSPTSDFIDTASGEYFTARQLFRKMYKNQTGHLVLQTCIAVGENPTWGRIFIIAEPVTQSPGNTRSHP